MDYTPGTMRVLVVDDEPLLTRILARFAVAGGFEPTVANNGVEAWRVFEREPDAWDLLITDIRMPGLDGVSLVRRIRESGSRIRVVFISGHGEPPDLDALAPAAFLPKPFMRAQILEAMEPPVPGT